MSRRRKQSKTITVYLPCCGEFIPEDEVGFLDIWEGPQGEDIMKFKCPECKKEHESKRFG